MTNGHCICTPEDPELPIELRLPSCERNTDRNLPINHIIPGREIYYIIGQKSIGEDIWTEEYYEVLKDLPQAEQAFIYERKEQLGTFYNDIGLLIVNILDWDIMFDLNLVEAIELPDMSDGYTLILL